VVSCIPGQSIACGGPFGCASFQVCHDTGDAYGPCDCPDSGLASSDGGLPDGYAPLPPTVGDQGYNAVWKPGAETLYVPIFSAPSCALAYPLGEYYLVRLSASFAPVGTFPNCGGAPCYSVERWEGDPGGGTNYQNLPNGIYTLSAFDTDGIARGQMNTIDGIVPLVVKYCP
jgi:hypothetical protein